MKIKWEVKKIQKQQQQQTMCLTEVDVEGAPLLRAGVKVPPFHMKIPGTDCLGTQPVEQGHLSP